jgi:hypothetical protein
MAESKDMNPISGEEVEVDGVYQNEWGRQVDMQRGNILPADPQLGTTEWELVEYTSDKIHPVKQDPHSGPRKHLARNRGDR